MLKHPRAPLIALALILLYSAGARVFRLGEPCSHPCTRGTDHTLIFDEAYYVNAARVIAGINPPRARRTTTLRSARTRTPSTRSWRS